MLINILENWTPERVRNLRGRLGWSQAEFARQLGVAMRELSSWERGTDLPSPDVQKKLLQFWHHADSVAEHVQRRPVADVLMSTQGLSQIHDADVINGVSDLADVGVPAPVQKKL